MTTNNDSITLESTVEHKGSGELGQVLGLSLRRGPYMGDLAGEWATIRWSNGEVFDCPVAELRLAGCYMHTCGACGQGHDGEHDCDLDPANELPAEEDHGPGCDGPLNCTCWEQALDANPTGPPPAPERHEPTEAELDLYWSLRNQHRYAYAQDVARGWERGLRLSHIDGFGLPVMVPAQSEAERAEQERLAALERDGILRVLGADDPWRCGSGHEHATESERDECEYATASPEEAERYLHRFLVWRSPVGQDMFAFRTPGEWLGDLLPMLELDAEVTDEDDRADTVEVLGSERALRTVCTLLNQHAEQSPGDLTPSMEAERLEQTLRMMKAAR